MSLVLHAHPLSSYCHKALTALYELQAPFELAFRTQQVGGEGLHVEVDVGVEDAIP